MNDLNHLDFYKKYGISPVHYDKTNLIDHFDRRSSLYRSLGLPPIAFTGSNCLEVAAGSGQNSLYIASLLPKSLTLVEPNPTAVGEIRNLYSNSNLIHTTPVLNEATLQDYFPKENFGIVICENWLGRSPSERKLLKKLGSFLDHQGILVLTTVSSTGLLPNMIRRALTIKYCSPRLPFKERSEMAVEMYEPHLSYMKHMTRDAMDWVQDNMLNPAYYDINLTLKDVIEELGTEFTLLGTSPNFVTDWRWFKSLYGDNRDFNNHMLEQYNSRLHNFLDFELEFSHQNIELNKTIDKMSGSFIESVRAYEKDAIQGVNSEKSLEKVINILRQILLKMAEYPKQIIDGIEVGMNLLESENLDCRLVSKKSTFSRLFGKETIYMSLMNDSSSLNK
jgi:ubiquinone/menaquinone biosynthesis C-methylase UbiE